MKLTLLVYFKTIQSSFSSHAPMSESTEVQGSYMNGIRFTYDV